MSEYDATEKLVKTETGFELRIAHKRGTGTRDQDEVKANLQTEELPDYDTWEELADRTTETMGRLRSHQPEVQMDE